MCIFQTLSRGLAQLNKIAFTYKSYLIKGTLNTTITLFYISI